MIAIDELRITNDGSALIIKAHVIGSMLYDTITNDWVYPFEDIYINSVSLDTDKTFNDGGRPSESCVVLYKKNQGDRDIKSIDLIVKNNLDNVNFKTDMIFIYFGITGLNANSDCVPCILNKDYTIGVTMYMGDIYKLFMSYIKEMNDNCQIPQGLIDLILRFKAVTTAIDSCHYTEGINYFNKFFKGDSVSHTSISNCGCHG